ncbi:hypothetical protein ABGB09_34205 [Streptomyces sp. B8F3]|uniref:hypothetical protein n=1 Tax=Streptomyces sp. B8F3 TaxID=3153573 RepID=UPI00325D5753
MLKRGAAATVLALTATVASAVPAAAEGGWGWTTCEQDPRPGCRLGAEQDDGDDGAPPDGGAAPEFEVPAPGGGGGGQAEPQADNPDLMNCAYEPAPDYRPPAEATATSHTPPADDEVAAPMVPAVFRSGTGAPGAVLAEPAQGEGPGAWYVWSCSGTGTRDALYRPPVWLPEGPPGEEADAGPSPATLAERAYEQLQLPGPDIASSPSGDQLVQVPTWLWLEGWEPVSATASVPGVSVRATARPTRAEWSLGDGSTVVCRGPGTPYQAKGDPSRPSPDCGHTYRSSSAGQPGDEYPVSVEVRWTVSWSGAGQSGTFPGLTTQATTAFRVDEGPALNTE